MNAKRSSNSNSDSRKKKPGPKQATKWKAWTIFACLVVLFGIVWVVASNPHLFQTKKDDRSISDQSWVEPAAEEEVELNRALPNRRIIQPSSPDAIGNVYDHSTSENGVSGVSMPSSSLRNRDRNAGESISGGEVPVIIAGAPSGSGGSAGVSMGTGGDFASGADRLSSPDFERWKADKSLRAKYQTIRLIGADGRARSHDGDDVVQIKAEINRIKSITENEIRKARAEMETGPDRANERLKNILEIVNASTIIDAELRKELQEKLLSALRQSETAVTKFEKMIAEEQKNTTQRIQRLGANHPDIPELERKLRTLEQRLLPFKTWKRVKAVPNTSRLMVGDKDELSLSGMQVNVQIDGFRARVVIDYFYYNDRDRQLEGSFKLRLPNESSPYYFAFGESRFDFTPTAENVAAQLDQEFIRGNRDDERFVSLDATSIRDLRKDAWDNVKEARMVPRDKAAFAYQQTTKRRIDPALVEWAGAGVFNAKVFPLSPHKLHRIVVGYDVNLTETDNRWIYQLELPEQAGDCRVDVRVSSTDQLTVQPAVEIDSFDQTANFRLDNPKQKKFAVSIPAEKGIVLKSISADETPFFATRMTLPFSSEANTGSSHAIFLVDTSLSAQPEKFNLWLKMLTRLLNDNRDIVKRFGIVFFNVEAYWWQPHYVDNTQKNVDELLSYCNRLSLEGATDLYSAIRLTTTTPWLNDQQNARPDLFLLSDGAATWGETNLQLIGRQLDSDSIGRMFAYQAGMTGTSIRALQFLTSKTGGAVFSIAGEKEAKSAAVAHRKKPWRLKSVEAVGGKDILTAGRVQWVYPDQSLLIVGRGDPTGAFEFELQSDDQHQTIKIPITQTLASNLAYRAYGQVAVGQLENLGNARNDISKAYARHFRVTGQTCSLLMLDSEQDYQRFKIKPEDDEFVVAEKLCSQVVHEEYAKNHAALADPKAMLLLWLKQLESAPQIEFKIPTALQLALDKVSVPVVAGKLHCKSRFKSQAEADFLQILKDKKLDYDQLLKQAHHRRSQFSNDDAIKVLSNLIEENPGDLQLLRDVAMMAMEFGQPEQAYPLLKKVAFARPFNAVVYTALGQCLVEMGNVDLAMVFYEIAVTGNFQKADFRKIATTEYVSLLGQIERGEHQTALKNYAKSRLKTLLASAPIEKADLVVTMMWNTDRTDVDLHVIDAAGEECYFKHKRTKMGGQITRDVTDGYGPEMFWLPNAQKGRYQIKVNYYGSDNLRTDMRSKVHVTVYQNFGTSQQTITRKTVSLGKTARLRSVIELPIDPSLPNENK